MVKRRFLFFSREGNVVAVRACARFPGWELHTHSAHLVGHISNEGMHFILLLHIHA